MDEPPLQELGTVVAEVFDKLIHVEQSNEWLEAQDLTSEAQRFQLWAQSLGLFQEGHASLDYRVRDAVFVRNRLAELLRELKDHIKELISILSGERKPAEQLAVPPEDDSSSNDSSSQSSSDTVISSGGASFHETDFRFQSLRERLDALYSLATRIRNPKNRPSRTNEQLYRHIPEEERAAYIQNREEVEVNIVSYILRQNILQSSSREEIEGIHGIVYEDILSQYSSPNSWIVRRTGRANARRKQQLVYWKDHALRLSQDKTKPTQSARPNILDEQKFAEIQEIEQPVTSGPQLITPSVATSATKLPVIRPDDLKSIISHQSRVSTIVDMNTTELNWPPPPAVSRENRHFECPYCKTICPVKYLDKGAWKTHVIHDIQAYHCTYERCQDQNRLYGSKQEWIDHENKHNRVWICPEHEEEFETQPNYKDHLEKKHPEFLSDRISEQLMDTTVGTSKQVHRDCPYCPAGFNEVKKMQQHISHHLIQFALLALRTANKTSDEGHESIISADSHQPKQLGRTKSVIGDFGLTHGLQKIPCAAVKIGSSDINYTRGNQLVFFDSKRNYFIIYMKDFQEPVDKLSASFPNEDGSPIVKLELIITYQMYEVSEIKLSPGADKLIFVVKHPPMFWKRLSNGKLDSTRDFTNHKLGSGSIVHTFNRPDYIHPKDFEELQEWLSNLMVKARHLETTREWRNAIERLESTTVDNNTLDWVYTCSPYNVQRPIPPSDVDNFLIETESLSWLSREEYDVAYDIAYDLEKKLEPMVLDLDCPICSAPAKAECDCEEKGLELAVYQAEEVILSSVYQEVRGWVRARSQDYLIEIFQKRTELANRTPEGIIPKQELNQIWRGAMQEYPEILQYFFSLTRWTVPSDEDDAMLKQLLSAPTFSNTTPVIEVAPLQDEPLLKEGI